MKTKKQVEHFLKQKKFKSKSEFDGINSFCLTKFNLKTHVPSKYFPEEKSALTYNAFWEWVEYGFGAGEAVKWGNSIGLVNGGDTDNVEICFRIDGNTPNPKPITVPYTDVTLTGESALNRLKLGLVECGKEFVTRFFIVSDKFIPSSGNLVSFMNYKTGAEGYGVVRGVNPQNEVWMYCYFTQGETVKYSMNEFLGRVEDFQFTSISAADYPRKLLDAELAKVGKTWNHHQKRVEPLQMKVKPGEPYWYLTEKLVVASAVEKGAVVSHKRYLAGNYFKRHEDAERMMQAEMELRRNFLAEPER